MPQFRAPTGELPPARRQARGRHQPRFHPCRCRGHAQAGAPLRQSPRGTCPAADDLDPTTVGVPDATKHPLSSNNSASHLAMPAAAIKQGKPGAKSTAKAPRRCCQASGTPSVRARWSARAKRCPVRNQDRAEGQLAPPESANLRSRKPGRRAALSLFTPSPARCWQAPQDCRALSAEPGLAEHRPRRDSPDVSSALEKEHASSETAPDALTATAETASVATLPARWRGHSRGR